MRLKWAFYLLFTAIIDCSARLQLGKGLISTVVSCNNEGQEVSVPLAVNNPCLRCMCKDKHIQCNKQECASLQNCYLVLNEDRNKCCNVCKGCFFNGTYVPNDYEWIDPASPCKQFICKSGIITTSNNTCVISCSSPMLPSPGKCCPTCSGCNIGGITVGEGEDSIHPEDPCVICRCKDGQLTCIRKVCPVLACRPSKIERRKPGECCPSCLGSRKVADVPHRCIVGSRNISSGTAFKIDECTKCTCVGTTSVCSRTNCKKEVILKEERPANDRPLEQFAHRSKKCMSEEKVYENGTSWVHDGCSTCKCLNGEILCSMKKCEVTKCPIGYRLDFKEDPCCPVCIDDQSTCSIFGQGYIKGFDEHVSQFKSGPCKYLLAGVCDSTGKLNRTHFSVSVSFRGKNNKRPIYTIELQDTTVVFGRYHSVRVNGVPHSLPHVQLGVFSLVKESFGMILRTNFGIRVFWDGVNLLNITVASTPYKSGCGLCGNINHNPRDDTFLPSGQMASSAKEWIASWRTGSLASCRLPSIKVVPSLASLRSRKKSKRNKRQVKLGSSDELDSAERTFRNLTAQVFTTKDYVTSLKAFSEYFNKSRGDEWYRSKRNSKVINRKSSFIVEGDLSADLAKFKKKKSSRSKGLKKPPVRRINQIAKDVQERVQGQLNPRLPHCQSWGHYFNVLSRCNEIGSYAYAQCHKKLKPSRYHKLCVKSACDCNSDSCEVVSTCNSIRSYSAECKALALVKTNVKIFCQSN
ncbi:BMP-binding endothelial regulator protein-like [Artemia franciscana]|uniref:BMP-binding endothelial regulator protein n=1 Tax=Artemia franciscana TaxID=6661 RepID=A0AA88HP58_ARTSF|nr:hypothetical protein QYM36_014106 [Artemia franciscana]KAK2708383.1 hypothetical protein QYM36_014106 [Artemia franciscana]